MINAQIGITPRTAASRAQLRADRIRRDTLTQLAAALVEDGDNGVINALHHLVDAMRQDAPDHAIDELVGDIESAARMDGAVMDLSDADVHQLAGDAVHAGAIADGSVTRIPQQREGGAAA